MPDQPRPLDTNAGALLTIQQAADTCGVQPATIRSWLTRYPDRIRTTKTPTGRVLIAETDVLDVEHDTRTTRRGRPRTTPA